MKTDLEIRLDDVLAMGICNWMINLFAKNVNKADVACQGSY